MMMKPSTMTASATGIRRTSIMTVCRPYQSEGDRSHRSKGADTVGECASRFSKYFLLRGFPQLFCLQRRHVGYTNFGTFEFANSIGAFSAKRGSTRALRG